MQRLTARQREQWAVDGFLHVEGALSADEVAFLGDELDRVRRQPGYEPSDLPRGHYGWLPHAASLDDHGFMDRRDLLGYHQAFVDLVDRPNVFDLIVDIMGPYLLFSMSQAIVRPSNTTFPGYTHTDGGEALRHVRVTETSRPIAMKAMYLLSDVEGTDAGNLTVFPGSHMRPFPDSPERWPNPHSPGAAQLQGKAGDCYLFPHSLWHGPAPNRSGRARKTLLYNYCQMFVRCYDFEVPPEIASRCTPRQRRLLGDLGHAFRPGSYFYAPRDQLEVITGETGESVLADTRPDDLLRA
ncbi:MAG: phytanoyl-CoA dioxygenase family protein [Ectothiorhodospiraceae bacterium]|nr:phytanoyl-CoA dioxygenase family protein [Chromatiales bacterium]MCP5153608.1 phytanoyl-CoA dioxygenase family protein [Ectothiorhodospiraceae bacterium]